MEASACELVIYGRGAESAKERDYGSTKADGESDEARTSKLEALAAPRRFEY